jgi:hypothetical protein
MSGGGTGVHDTTLCDNVCQWLAAGPSFFPGTPVSSTNNTDRHVIAEILLKVTLNTIKQTNKQTKTKENKQIKTKQNKQKEQNKTKSTERPSSL